MVGRIYIFLAAGLFIVTVSLAVGRFLRPVTSPPTSPPGSSITTPAPNIPTILLPESGGTVSGPLVIKGFVPKSWTFEGQFRMQLLDNRRQTILTDRVPVEWDNENIKDRLYFVESYNYRTSAESGFLVLLSDNPSGLPENEKKVEIPIYFTAPPPDTAYLFLYDSAEDRKICDCVACQVVLPIPVTIGRTSTPIKDTLNILAERMHPDFYVKSINLKAGVLTVEFPEIPGFTEGGSCKQGINASQIVKTARQFSEVKSVRFLPKSMFQP